MLSCSFLKALWSPVVERADLLDLFSLMFSCDFVTFSYGVLFEVILSISDLCLLPNYKFNFRLNTSPYSSSFT